MLPLRTALHCLARTCCINAAVTARGMQEIGLLFVLEPALRVLYPNAAARTRARARYTGHSNTHVFMAPLYVGILLSVESIIARGDMPEAALHSVRETLATSLSALGDSFFGGGMLPLWALTSVCLILAGLPGIMAIFSISVLLLLLIFRISSFFLGLRHGLTILVRLKRLNLINKVAHLKTLNAALIALTLGIAVYGRPDSMILYVCGALAVPAAAWLVGKRHLPRILLWVLTLILLILMDAELITM